LSAQPAGGKRWACWGERAGSVSGHGGHGTLGVRHLALSDRSGLASH
jgi:hypothetical protein